MMSDGIYWRTYYAGGGYQDEPLGTLSIRAARPRPLHLALCVQNGQTREPVERIDLTDEQPLPVWYRRRSTALSGGPLLDVVTDAVVFGRAGASGEASLWASHEGRVVPCPPELYSERAIAVCLGR